MWIDNRSGDMIQVNNWTKEKPKKIEIPEETRIKKIKLIMEYYNDWEFDKFDEETKKFISEKLNFPNISDNVYSAIINSLKGWYCDHITAFLILCNIEWYTKKVPEIDKLKDESDSWWDGNAEDLTEELKELFKFSKPDIPEMPVEPLIPTYWWNVRKYYVI